MTLTKNVKFLVKFINENSKNNDISKITAHYDKCVHLNFFTVINKGIFYLFP